MVSVLDVTSDPGLGLVVRHLPRPEAEVRWVAVSELDDPTPFLEGGEIVLTTALEMASWREEWHDYVKRLAEARVCALGLATDLTLDSAPTELLAAAELWQLNLIEVPRDTTFVAISRAVAELLRAGENRAAQRSLEMHQALTRAAAKSDDPAEILRALADALKGMAAILGVDGALRVGPLGPMSTLFDAESLAAETARIRPRGLHAASSVVGNHGTLVVQPIGVRGRPTRYFVAGFDGPATPVHQTTIAAAVALLNLAEERRNDQLETRRKLAGRAIELLIHGDHHGAELLMGATGENLHLPPSCQVLRGAGPVSEVEEALELAESLRGITVLAVVDHELVAVGRPRAIAEFATALAARLRVGVGRSVPRGEIGVGYRTAGLALAGASEGAPTTWGAHEPIGIASLIADDKAQAFAEGTLLSLDPDLRATLLVFLRHHGSQVRVARELDIHRNTVLQRVRAIEAQLDRSLDDAQTRVDLWVALQVAAAIES